MTFGEKLKKLRTSSSLTQEELAGKLYVTRTAISKWESGRGYPSIDSLKIIAHFFSITVDELLSSDEILKVAEENQKRTEKGFCDLLFGLLDICMSLLLLLPLFSSKGEDIIKGASLIMLDGVELYLKISYFIAVFGITAFGILTLALQKWENIHWARSKTKISLCLSTLVTLLFIVSLQPYASVFAFSLLFIKTAAIIKRP